MQSTLNPKQQSDDPHDFVVVPSDAVRVAPADEELSNLLHQAARQRSEAQNRAVSEVAAASTIPPVDTTFRPAAANDDTVSARRSIGRRVLRPLIALLLAGCIGLVAVAWRSYGDTVKTQIARWTTKAVLTLSLQETPGSAAEAATPAAAADTADTANAAPAQPAAPSQSETAAVAPAAADSSADSAQQLQSMARDLASLGQEVEQLKASLEQLKAGQQISRDAAKASEARAAETRASETRPVEQNPRAKASASPPRPAAAQARKPAQPAPAAAPQAAASQAPAPYVPRQPDYAPRQPEYAPRQSDYAPRPDYARPPADYYGPRYTEPQPRVIAEPQADAESIPRPPMPLR